ncbi:MAG: FkbM family methyltransferase [Chitinophagaceae bacterium]
MMQIDRYIYPALRIRKVLLGKDFFLGRDIKPGVLTLGNPHAEWTFIPDALDESSVVYSFGAGGDISFETRLSEKFNSKIYIFDPTPSSISWMATQTLPPRVYFHPVGIAAEDGYTDFYAPRGNGTGSHSKLKNEYATAPIKVPMKRLVTIMKEQGHHFIDLLKMDIEGAEYEVLEEIINNHIPVRQLLVEFHHRFKTIGIKRSLDAIGMLKKTGYVVFSVSPTGEEISFINTHYAMPLKKNN